jgi:hypothetical protein
MFHGEGLIGYFEPIIMAIQERVAFMNRANLFAMTLT